MPQVDQPTLLIAEPQVFVDDMESVRAFYLDRLGFSLAFSYGDLRFYAQVRRGAARLNLRFVHTPAFALDFYAREANAISATISVEGIERLFSTFDAPG